MRKPWNTILTRIAVTGILFLLFVSGTAFAAKDLELTASVSSGSGQAVMSRNGKYGTILSLPGSWDLKDVKLELKGSEKFWLGPEKQEIRSGESVDLTGMTGTSLTVVNENKRKLGSVTILQGSKIPSLYLTVRDSELKKAYRGKSYEIKDARAVFEEADGSVSYDGALEQLKCRGNITFSYLKKPFQFKLANKASLGGMGSAKTWILLANYVDVSMLRNQIVLDMSREIGMKYAISCRQVDVWINGVYHGLYLLAEKIQIKKGRVEIRDLEEATEKVNGTPLDPGEMKKERRTGYELFRSYPAVTDPQDITGGYIVTIEKNFRMQKFDQAGFRTGEMLNIYIREPTCPSTAQVEYLGKLFTEMHHALLATDGIAPETGKSYREYLNAGSFALKYLIEDWSKNYDYLGGSQYIYKDSDKVDPLLRAGPAWDYDLSFGNMSDRGHSSGGNFLINFKQKNNLYWLLYNKEDFREQLSALWQESFFPAAQILLGEKPPEENSVIRPFDEYCDAVRDSVEMNNRRWGISTNATAKEAGGSFDQAVKYLKKWITERTAAMDQQFGSGAKE